MEAHAAAQQAETMSSPTETTASSPTSSPATNSAATTMTAAKMTLALPTKERRRKRQKLSFADNDDDEKKHRVGLLMLDEVTVKEDTDKNVLADDCNQSSIGSSGKGGPVMANTALESKQGNPNTSKQPNDARNQDNAATLYSASDKSETRENYLDKHFTKSSAIVINGETREATTVSATQADDSELKANAMDSVKVKNEGEPSSTQSQKPAVTKPSQHQKYRHQQQQPNENPQLNQPPGWRVKLYRLNQDGTWDDCGTGRIQFYFAKAQSSINPIDGHSSQSSPKNIQSLHQAIYREVGEPMLCMRAELPPRTNNAERGGNVAEGSPMKSAKVLLRTRVLLHDAYQCQGGNIVTWCEPFHVNSGGQQKDGQQQQKQIGVDLALSFQDNDGCKDVWRRIMDVQLRAKELSQIWTQSNGGSPSITSKAAKNSSNTASTLHISAAEQRSNESSVQYFSHQPLSPTDKSHHAHVHQPLSPHSPDHDALEDKQLSMVSMPKHPPLFQVHHGHLHSNSSQNQLRQQHLGQQHRHDEKEEAQLNESHDDDEHVSNGGQMVSHGEDSSSNSMNQNEGGTIDRAPSPLSLYQDMNSCTSNGVAYESSPISLAQLPNPPKWSDLEEIVNIIENSPMQQKEDLVIFFSQSDCAYLKTLLGLFHSEPEDQLDLERLNWLAVCIKLVLLLNDPEIIEYVTTDEETFYSVCGVLEYTPGLCEKANYRKFIREKAKFRTVVKMEDEELMAFIHRLFRVNYLKDFILRPALEESSLSTLASLAQFTQSDIIKGVIHAVPQENDPNGVVENYFTKVLRVLGNEIESIRRIQGGDMVKSEELSNLIDFDHARNDTGHSSSNSQPDNSTIWSQHVVPQDSSLPSRLMRRKGCLSFIREMFNMARTSLQQQEKDEFVPFCVSTTVQLAGGLNETQLLGNNTAHDEASNEINMLFLLGAVLSDPGADINEKSAALEILSAITIHDPSIVRRHCLEASRVKSGEKTPTFRPEPDASNQIIFVCPPDDLMQSLLLVMSTESDAGLLLQTSEIIRIILDTEMMGEQMNDENEGLPGNSFDAQNWCSLEDNSMRQESSEQFAFLSTFYERYLPWLFAPFNYKILVPKAGFLLNSTLKTIIEVQQNFKQASPTFNIALRTIPPCTIRLSFTFEILSFCVRAHIDKMKAYVLKTRLLGTTLKLLSQRSGISSESEDRCLKLASLKLLRSVLSVKDEFYHRHIVQHNLFLPVFELFRAIPVGNNLVSSAILEMCDFIRTENIKSLVHYIVTKHLSSPTTSTEKKSLETIADPYVDTFKQLRKKYEENTLPAASSIQETNGQQTSDPNLGDNRDAVKGAMP
eukprot:scaffold10562_cov90-Cyclotella_meneghiniana.AAC.2